MLRDEHLQTTKRERKKEILENMHLCYFLVGNKLGILGLNRNSFWILTLVVNSFVQIRLANSFSVDFRLSSIRANPFSNQLQGTSSNRFLKMVRLTSSVSTLIIKNRNNSLNSLSLSSPFDSNHKSFCLKRELIVRRVNRKSSATSMLVKPSPRLSEPLLDREEWTS